MIQNSSEIQKGRSNFVKIIMDVFGTGILDSSEIPLKDLGAVGGVPTDSIFFSISPRSMTSFSTGISEKAINVVCPRMYRKIILILQEVYLVVMVFHMEVSQVIVVLLSKDS